MLFQMFSRFWNETLKDATIRTAISVVAIVIGFWLIYITPTREEVIFSIILGVIIGFTRNAIIDRRQTIEAYSGVARWWYEKTTHPRFLEGVVVAGICLVLILLADLFFWLKWIPSIIATLLFVALEAVIYLREQKKDKARAESEKAEQDTSFKIE